MKYENPEVETWLLEKGVHKLKDYGMDVFEMFADENDISFCDRNRVIAKCRVAYGKDFKEMPCLDNLKNERWEYYAKTLRYPKKHALSLMKRIDESYENQFNPVANVKSITSGMLKGV